ncbi:hypothetical protein T484DRAFT_1906048 [Baffinella frigidus]|nr:hypothetical protein T484DRAFT_1906048 [Cryptophyta sp. CCMP2293]
MDCEMIGVATYELPTARTPRSCLKRSMSEDIATMPWTAAHTKRAATPARRALLAHTISVVFVRDKYEDDAHAPEHAPRDVGKDTATRRSGWVDDQDASQIEAMAVHDGPLPESRILCMLFQALASSQDLVPILSLLCQHRSAQLFRNIEERIIAVQSRIATRGSTTLFPANVILGIQSIALLNFLSESVTQASRLIPCTDVPTIATATQAPAEDTFISQPPRLVSCPTEAHR